LNILRYFANKPSDRQNKTRECVFVNSGPFQKDVIWICIIRNIRLCPALGPTQPPVQCVPSLSRE